MKDICERCGKSYDVEEWVRCPHCATKEYEERRNYPRPLRFITGKTTRPVKIKF